MRENSEKQQRINNLIAGRIYQKAGDQIIEAKQILTEMEAIDSSSAYKLVQNRIQRNKITYRLLNTFSRVAAILFIPLLISSIWLFNRKNSSIPVQQYSMQEITSPPGIRSQVVLPDGTKVWLNAESTIKFPVPFHTESRNVNLTGEAFFDVIKNPNQPFIVESEKVKVKVLGTRFNYKAYSNDPTVEVILEEGKIALSMPYDAFEKEAIMKPGDRLVYKKESNNAIIENENIDKYIAWHTGKLVFDNTPMTEVAQLLARWYGVDVIVKNAEIMNYRFTTTFENESLFQVIELLGLSSPIQIKYVPATLGKDNQAKSYSKVIINKKQN
jgi:ferric-dicitrate binding protein FerR (iron transport regulator)